MTDSTRATSVYRYYDDGNALIYVGITSRGVARNLEHAQGKEWWPYVARQTVEHYDAREQAEQRERKLIRKFRPPFNKHHNVDHEGARSAYLSLARGERRPTLRELIPRLNRQLPLQVVERDGAIVFLTHPEHEACANVLRFPKGKTVKVTGPNGGRPFGKVRDVDHAGACVAITADVDELFLPIDVAVLRIHVASMKGEGELLAKSILAQAGGDV